MVTFITRSVIMKLVIIACIVTLSAAIETQWLSEKDIPDFKYLDPSVDPCDNFYQYTCGKFKEFHPRPDDVKMMDLFKITEDELISIGNEILTSPKLHGESQALKKAKSAYNACVKENFALIDTDVNVASPELVFIKEFGGMPLLGSKNSDFTWNDIADIIGKTGIQQMFKFTIQNFDPERYILMMSQDEWQDPEMIRARSTKTYDEILEETLKKAPRKISSRISADDALDTFLWNITSYLFDRANPEQFENKTLKEELKKDVDQARNFTTQLLNGGIPVEGSSEPEPWAGYIKDLQELTQEKFLGKVDIQWVDYLNRILKLANIQVNDNTTIFIADLNNVYAVLNLALQTNPSVIKNAILLRTFLYLAPDSSPNTRAAFKQFCEASGYTYYNRSEYCTRKILDVVDSVSLSFAVTHAYEKYHFNINKIRKAVQLINDLRHSYKTLLSNSDWLDHQSRDATKQKVKNMVISLAYPDFVHHKKNLDGFYGNVRICEWDNYGNSIRMRAFKQAYAFTEYVDRKFWQTSPFEVNAYAIVQNNKIMVPISMLSGGFFPGNNSILDYSRLGTTLAHEMTHHFDTKGVRYDANGYQNKLLTNASQEAFMERLQCLEEQYSGYYVPEVGKWVDGVQTLNENLADNGGIRASFAAYQKLIREKKIGNLSQNYTLEQLFFISYGTMWCSEESLDFLEELVTSNTHPPSRVRINGTLSNLKEFSDAFNCPIGSKMNPEKKCVVW